MANKDNKLSHLRIGKNQYPDLDMLFETQKSLQSFIADKKGIHDITDKNHNIGMKVLFLMANKHAFEDEWCELMDAMGGINDGAGSAAWKWWKDENPSTATKYLSDLSEDDLIELKMEYVDALHFFINFGLILGMTGSEVMNIYLAKNAENIDRQKRGY